MRRRCLRICREKYQDLPAKSARVPPRRYHGEAAENVVQNISSFIRVILRFQCRLFPVRHISDHSIAGAASGFPAAFFSSVPGGFPIDYICFRVYGAKIQRRFPDAGYQQVYRGKSHDLAVDMNGG